MFIHLGGLILIVGSVWMQQKLIIAKFRQYVRKCEIPAVPGVRELQLRKG